MDLKKLKDIQKRSRAIRMVFEKHITSPLHCELSHIHPLSGLFIMLKHHAIACLGKNKTYGDFLSQSDVETLRHQASTYVGSTEQKLSSHLFLLSTVTSLAPFLGLLGTVWGILLTFSELQSGLHLQAQATVMGGLAMALGTTVIGLLVAIPALIGHNMIQSKIDTISYDIETFAERVISSLELTYKKIDTP